MPAFFARGTQKPPWGAPVDWAHPFAADMVLTLPFQNGRGAIDLIRPAAAIPILQDGDTSHQAWASNSAGSAYRFTAVDAFLQVMDIKSAIIPTTACTILLVRRKLDLTLREGVAFGTDTNGSCQAFLPWTDGTAYWDFGGTSAPNRLTASGIPVTTAPEAWVLTAGSRGSAIWRNGVRLASQSTAITRAASSNNFYINRAHYGNSGDVQDYNWFQLIAAQWPDALCQRWSAEPYVLLYGGAFRSVFPLAEMAAASRMRRTLSPLGTRTGSRQER